MDESCPAGRLGVVDRRPVDRHGVAAGLRAGRVAGLVAAVWLFAHSFVSPFVGKVAIYPASIMVLVRLAVVAWQDGVRR